MNDNNEMPAIDTEMVSDCCYAPVYTDYEMCSRCGEHCGMVPDEEL